MSYINQIVEDGVTYDIAAKNLVNGFTQTTPGVNALDAAAGKSLNDAFENSKHDTATIPANSTTTIPVDFTVNAFRLLCIGHNNQAGLRGIYILRGTQTPLAIIPAASITLSNQTATSIDVTNGTGYTASAIVV